MTIPTTNSGGKNRINKFTKGYGKLLTEFKREQAGYSSIAIIPQSCIGSMAAMMLLLNDWAPFSKLTLLFLVTILCMAYNGAVLAQLKSKTTFNLLLLSIAFSCSVIIVNLF